MITMLLPLALSACDLDDLIDKEEAVAIADLPAAVVDAIEDEWPDATLLEAEREGDVYEVEIRTAGDALLEVELEEDGTILDVEEEGDESDDD